MLCGGKNLMLVYEERKCLGVAVMSVIYVVFCHFNFVVDICRSFDLCCV